ncbi:VIT and vWA domain-containing protein [Rhodotorula paludigena]|uniref:VIT and vWA domain-containing protein n=1 Tax=Rhodotorula paludigena TaxID=86838 RepID=UPI00317E7B2D
MHGLIHYVDGQPATVPLMRVAAKATIVDLSARVQVTQEYRNDSSETLDCSYQFPVPACGAVCAFAMLKADGSRIRGVVQEKEEARATYDEAVEQGRLASLMEQDSPDTFTCKVGNIMPRETVIVELTYVTELTEGETSDSYRFHVPSHVGCRYGDPPSSAPAGVAASDQGAAFSVDVSIEAAAPISKVDCTSHAVSTELGPDPSLSNADNLPFANFARVSCKTAHFLSSDVVLQITSAGVDRPRCIVERHPAQDSAAISLTVVPRFSLPEVTGQEFVFLVDRSGSMGEWGFGSTGAGRITLARKALVVLLRSLPHRDTTFNIVSFGSTHSALWEKGSRAYNQSTLDEATKHVDSMEANFGGTEICSALDYVFKVRDTKRPTSVFVLTDGDAWELDAVLSSVKDAVASATTEQPLRVFTLGIGNSASTAMVDGIARVGNGTAQYVTDGDQSFTGKTARLLKAARSPQILNARLDFGESADRAMKQACLDDDFEVVDATEGTEKLALEDKADSSSKAPLNLFDESVDPLAQDVGPAPPAKPVELPSPPPLQLAPRAIRGLYPGTRLHAYGIVSPASLLHDKVTLRGELASGQQLALEIPVVEAHSVGSSTADNAPFVHAIAARKLIQDLEDGEHDFASSLDKKDDDLVSRTVKAAVVRLGKTYSLASSHTSFVAVDEAEVDAARKQRKRIALPPPPMRAPVLFGGAPPAPGASPFMRSRMAAPAAATFSTFAAVPPAPPAPAPAAAFGAPMMAACFAPPPAAPAPSGGGGLFGSRGSAAGGLFGHQQSSAVGWGGGAGLFGGPAAGAAVGEAAGTAPPPKSKDPASLSPSERIDALAREQDFGGAFSTAALRYCGSKWAGGVASVEVAGFEGASETVKATLAVLAYFEQELGQHKEEWEGLADKATDFVAGELGVEVDEVQRLVDALKG